MVADDLMVEIADPFALSERERDAILRNCARAGLSFYRLRTSERAAVASVWHQLGLRSAERTSQSDEDGINRITVVAGARYIPYTDAPLCWHTDGYYSARAVLSFAMHCVRPAASGGANGYFNPETLYQLLRDEARAHVAALERADAMTIPANVVDGRVVRAAHSAPVFSRDAERGLHTRWTERERNIVWADDEAVARARDACRRILRDETTHRIHKRLLADEGVVCNNVLHCREPFEDDAKAPRLVYRGRYYERVGARIGESAAERVDERVGAGAQ